MDDLIAHLRALAIGHDNPDIVATLHQSALQVIDRAADRIESLQRELETERIRLAACGVVAMANTRESAALQRKMLPEYESASCDDVARAVDREMQYREQVEALQRERDALSMECERRQQFAESAVRVLSSIHALLYPAQVVTTDAGKIYVFRPTTIDPHEILQALSNRIRAIPSEIDAARAALGGKHAE